MINEFFSRIAVSRRQFLQQMGLTLGAAAFLSPAEVLSGTANAASPQHIVIVGAGMAGLSAAYELEQRGHRVTILEADAKHVGGRVRTWRHPDGHYGELGAMRIPLQHTLTRHYAQLFGLTLRPFVQSNPKAYYYVRGHRVRIANEDKLNPYFHMKPAEQDKTPFDFWKKSILSLLNSLTEEELKDLRRTVFKTERMRELDRLSLQEQLLRSGLSIEAREFLTTTFGLETSLQSGLTSILLEAYEEIWLQPFDEIVGGTDRLPKAFAKNLISKPQMGCQVIRLEQDASAKTAAAVYVQNGVEKRVEGDMLLCTLPLGPLSRLTVTPEFSGPKARAIRQVNYESATKVLALARQRFWESDDGIYGGGTYTDLPTAITYYPSDNAGAKDPAVSNGPGVMLASYTWGLPARRLMALSPNERVRVVREHLSKVHPQMADPSMVTQWVHWSWDAFPLSSGAYAWFSPGDREYLYRSLILPEGRIFFAGEHISLSNSWMQGALESALRAVKQMLVVAAA
ncbi:MAG: FAD-dependent oxidoreductase [Gammaproteobacteria bacterium]